MLELSKQSAISRIDYETKVGQGGEIFADQAVQGIVGVVDGLALAEVILKAMWGLSKIGTDKANSELVKLGNSYPDLFDVSLRSSSFFKQPAEKALPLLKAFLEVADVGRNPVLSLALFNEVTKHCEKSPEVMNTGDIRKGAQAVAICLISQSWSKSESLQADLWEGLLKAGAGDVLREFNPVAALEAYSGYVRMIHGEEMSPFAYDHEFTFKG